MYSTRVWKVDSICIRTICHWNLCFIGFPKIYSSSRTSQIHLWMIDTSFRPFKGMGAQMAKNSQIQPLPLEARWPPSNTSMPGPTPLTMPNDRSIGSRTSVQLCNKDPFGYNGMPQFTPKTATSPSTITIKNTDPTYHPKRHPFPVSRFATIPFLDRQTHTDRWARQQVHNMSAPLTMLIESDALIIIIITMQMMYMTGVWPWVVWVSTCTRNCVVEPSPANSLKLLTSFSALYRSIH